MTKRIFEFVCDNNHISERLVEDSVREVECVVCGVLAHRIVSAVRCSLEGITGDFPGAYAKWNNVHREASRVANKRRNEHGVSTVDPSGM
jgi:hypothetical protein